LSNLQNEVNALKSEVKEKNDIIETLTKPYKASPSENNALLKSIIVKKRSSAQNFDNSQRGKRE
jgi:hypothetical protein